MTKRLRIAQVIVQPVLVWDDGEEITPGPQAQQQSLTLTQLRAMVDSLPAEVARLEAELLTAEDAPPAE